MISLLTLFYSLTRHRNKHVQKIDYDDLNKVMNNIHTPDKRFVEDLLLEAMNDVDEDEFTRSADVDDTELQDTAKRIASRIEIMFPVTK